MDISLIGDIDGSKTLVISLDGNLVTPKMSILEQRDQFYLCVIRLYDLF